MAFLGGEPTLYPDIEQYIYYASLLGLRTQLITNGILLAEQERIKSLERSNVSGINISLKGFFTPKFY